MHIELTALLKHIACAFEAEVYFNKIFKINLFSKMIQNFNKLTHFHIKLYITLKHIKQGLQYNWYDIICHL